MKNISFLTPSTIFFVGIGGISMSGLAKICISLGHKVLGSDISKNVETEKLTQLGVEIFYNQDGSHIGNDIDFLVYSGAISPDNPELKMAKKLSIPTLERSEFLGLVAKMYRNVIAISGTHGKTTTTSMIAEILEYSGLNPTIHIGGESINLKTNTLVGGKKYFVVEACEYRESFKYLHPKIAVITNIESDHLDYYKTFENIKSAFDRFAKKSETVVTTKTTNIVKDSQIIIGKDIKAVNICYTLNGYDFDVVGIAKKPIHFRLNTIGIFNVYNALFAIAVCRKLKIPIKKIQYAIENFKGVERRHEKIGYINSTPVIIDYAHHPTEIGCSIEAIGKVYSRVLVIFQPHTYSRTKTLFNEFVTVFNKVSNLIIFDTYPARESEILGGRAIDLYNAIKSENKNYFDNVDKLVEYCSSVSADFDAILVLGAGNLAENIKKLI